MARLEFWFEYASSYSYPATFAVGEACRAAGVELVWKPFILGPIFAAQGWNTSPFNLYPAKGKYMVRDLERICEKAGLPFRLDPDMNWPQFSIAAARIGLIGAREGWVEDFSKRLYALEFGDNLDISKEETLRQALDGVADADRVLAESRKRETKDALRAQVGDAVAAGIFGAPTYRVGDEIFWGGDRLDDALAWAITNTL
ncbi:2-hydroxychromene-2-carboxylate isomerase [Hyphobacterium sp.]|jgi:2-hydroxychromene-2-carboxylate isomerase|uniref:2-hydroxychromene-2-carboxylate isomerase n=1 Tax=Hyphobacterium sp. TaxID=2004662 RepID=UPI003BABDF68